VEVGRGREEMRKGNDELLRKHFQALTWVRVSLSLKRASDQIVPMHQNSLILHMGTSERL